MTPKFFLLNISSLSPKFSKKDKEKSTFRIQLELSHYLIQTCPTLRQQPALPCRPAGSRHYFQRAHVKCKRHVNHISIFNMIGNHQQYQPVQSPNPNLFLFFFTFSYLIEVCHLGIRSSGNSFPKKTPLYEGVGSIPRIFKIYVCVNLD